RAVLALDLEREDLFALCVLLGEVERRLLDADVLEHRLKELAAGDAKALLQKTKRERDRALRTTRLEVQVRERASEAVEVRHRRGRGGETDLVLRREDVLRVVIERDPVVRREVSGFLRSPLARYQPVIKLDFRVASSQSRQHSCLLSGSYDEVLQC